MLASNSMFSRRMVLKAGALISVYPASRLFAQIPEPLKISLLRGLTMRYGSGP
jgi:hypothetical protein